MGWCKLALLLWCCGVVPINTRSGIRSIVLANILWHFKLSRQSTCKDSQNIRI